MYGTLVVALTLLSCGLVALYLLGLAIGAVYDFVRWQLWLRGKRK